MSPFRIWISNIPADEPHILLGHLNACIGSRVTDNDTWGRVYGPHGYGNWNDAGKELLTFLATSETTVCNTWFKKKNIHKQTWSHPKSKK